MLVKLCHKPPMIGNSKNTTYRNGDLADGSLLFHIHCPNWGFMTKNGLAAVEPFGL